MIHFGEKYCRALAQNSSFFWCGIIFQDVFRCCRPAIYKTIDEVVNVDIFEAEMYCAEVRFYCRTALYTREFQFYA